MACGWGSSPGYFSIFIVFPLAPGSKATIQAHFRDSPVCVKFFYWTALSPGSVPSTKIAECEHNGSWDHPLSHKDIHVIRPLLQEYICVIRDILLEKSGTSMEMIPIYRSRSWKMENKNLVRQDA